MTLNVSKKDFIYGILITILLITTSASFLAYKAGAEESANSSIQDQSVDGQTSPESNDSSESLDLAEGVDLHIPHLSCVDQINYANLPTSTTYNPANEYNNSLLHSGINFQDVNGDGLPDYSYTSHSSGGGGSELQVVYRGCVLLNNGTGWDRAYICYARTTSNVTTGNVTDAQYKGDCADTSAVSGGASKE